MSVPWFDGPTTRVEDSGFDEPDMIVKQHWAPTEKSCIEKKKKHIAPFPNTMRTSKSRSF